MVEVVFLEKNLSFTLPRVQAKQSEMVCRSMMTGWCLVELRDKTED